VLADTPMLIVCPNCATSYGVAMASLRPAGGFTRKLRCQRCRWVWQAQLSDTDKLKVAADAVPPVRRTMAAIAQAAADAAWSALPRLRRATTVLADELDAAVTRADRAPVGGASAEPAGAERAGAPSAGPIERIAATLAPGAGAVSRQRLWWWRAWWLNWRQSWRQFWWLRRPSLSRLQCIILALALTDDAIIGERADVVWAMPQTASFFAALGLPVNLRGFHFDRLAAMAERRDGEPVLIVQGAIGNSTTASADVPLLRFAIRNAEHQEIYSWTAAAGRGRLSAGHKLAFRSELILPPPDTRDVVVRFVGRDDSL
jgi:predicted Zn finger-like uncharacterized protein